LKTKEEKAFQPKLAPPPKRAAVRYTSNNGHTGTPCIRGSMILHLRGTSISYPGGLGSESDSGKNNIKRESAKKNAGGREVGLS